MTTLAAIGSPTAPMVVSLRRGGPCHQRSRRPCASRCLAIVPAFQERDAIAQVIDDIRGHSPVDIVVIDDGSGDGTAAEAVRAGARVITLPFNLGIGSAVQTGYMVAPGGRLRHRDPGRRRRPAPGRRDRPADRRAHRERCRHRDRLALRRASGTTGRRSAGASASRSSRASSRRSAGYANDRHDLGLPRRHRRAISLFAAAYPHDYPEVEAVIIAHRAGLRIVEIPVQMRVRQGGPFVDHARCVGLLHAQGHPGVVDGAAATSREARQRALTRITLVSLIVAFVLLLFVLELVRRRRLQERYSVLWLRDRAACSCSPRGPPLLARIADVARHPHPVERAVRRRRSASSSPSAALLARHVAPQRAVQPPRAAPRDAGGAHGGDGPAARAACRADARRRLEPRRHGSGAGGGTIVGLKPLRDISPHWFPAPRSNVTKAHARTKLPTWR